MAPRKSLMQNLCLSDQVVQVVKVIRFLSFSSNSFPVSSRSGPIIEHCRRISFACHDLHWPQGAAGASRSTAAQQHSSMHSLRFAEARSFCSKPLWVLWPRLDAVPVRSQVQVDVFEVLADACSKLIFKQIVYTISFELPQTSFT